MVRSMTGYGKAESVVADKRITVEVRALNCKQLDLSLRMPSLYRSLDSEIRSIASKILQRGKIDVYINTESIAGQSAASIDKAVFNNYYSQLLEIARENGLSTPDADNSAIFASVLRLPEVISANNASVPEEEVEAVKDAVTRALTNAESFREQEGAVLIEDILKRVDTIEQSICLVEPFEGERVEAVKKRIADGVERIGIAVDSNRLEQELIFYFEKLDITEEKVRLANHCQYFREVVAKEENPGRKLGFISQEMGREINTLGSKANHSHIQHIVVLMKDELEKIKEQLLNIL